MASSSLSLTSSQRRRAHQKLSRSNSSFLSAIKSIVTAPLSWFAGNDEFEDSKGKRRRLALEPISEDEDRSSRLKRMRVDSPPRNVNQSQTSYARSAAYLDPPAHVFKPQRPGEHVHLDPRSSSLIIPSPTLQEPSLNSTIITANTLRSTLPPSRNLSRTMSVDPPARMLRREPAMMNIPLHREVSSETPPRSSPQRELSMPLMPQSSRLFRLRGSMTPQPLAPTAQRELSEPPPLSSLVINPVFVRAPSSQPTESQQRSAAGQMVTLGSLVDVSKSARSVIRQHSSLLPNVSQPSDTQLPRQQSPAEKALHELDIYKTPLLPSRLRLSIETSQSMELDAPSSVPDLFRSRRTSKLVLMHDEKRPTRFGTKGGDPRKVTLANDTKPYAGEGGMKKLLARRKLEIEMDEEQRQGAEDGVHRKDKRMDNETPELSFKSGPDSGYFLTRTDWLASASIADRPSNSASSLRVGRDRRRNHIARPKAKLVKLKFSAAFDEDDAMDAGVNDEKGKAVTEDVASKTFIFNPPPDFSFLQNDTPSLQGSDEAVDLPIPSLPFSLTKSQDVKVDALKPNSPFLIRPTAESKSNPTSQAEPSEADTNLVIMSSVVPNFFANSKMLSKSMGIAVSPPLDFKLSSIQDPDERPLFTLPSTVLTDTSHVLRETEKQPDRTINANVIFNDPASAPVKGATVPPAIASSHSIPPSPTDATINIAGTETTVLDRPQPDDTMQAAQMPMEEGSIEIIDPMNAEGNHPISEPNGAKSISNTDTSTGTNKLVPRKLSVEHGLTQNNRLVSGQGFTSTSSNTDKIPGALETISFMTGSTPSLTPSIARSELEPSKPLFGMPNESMTPKPSFGGFSFQVANVTNKNKAQTPVNSAISLSASLVEVQPEQKKSTVFTFGAPQPQTPASTSSNIFSFAGGGSVTGDVSKPFTFGASTTSGVSLPGRPITPPKTQEVQMEESPTRDIQSCDTKSTALGFPFSQNITSSLFFGAQTNGNATNSSPFNFGSSQSVATNAFAPTAREVKTEKPINFTQASSFSFSQSNKVSDVGGAAQSPTNGPFSFGSSATSFTFGSQSNTSSNPFGQPQASSTPSSPATFGSPFSFGPPTSNSAFTFGSSQPASPVSGGNLSLPQAATSTSFGTAGFGQSTPSSPFSTTSPLVPAAPGTPLFTIGSAPTTTPNAPRQIKKLPTRRGGKR